MRPYLTDQEINDICDGLQQPAAMIRYLRHIGLTVVEKPNGRPLVSREHFTQVMAGKAITPPKPAPAANVAGVVAMFQRKAVA